MFNQHALFENFLNTYDKSNNPFFDPSKYGLEDQTLLAQQKIGSIPPTSVTNEGFGFLPFGIGASRKVPYKAQEYGLYKGDGTGYAPQGVTLGGGRSGLNPGTGFAGHGPQSSGYSTKEELFFRSPIDKMQLQLRKFGIPGM